MKKNELNKNLCRKKFLFIFFTIFSFLFLVFIVFIYNDDYIKPETEAYRLGIFEEIEKIMKKEEKDRLSFLIEQINYCETVSYGKDEYLKTSICEYAIFALEKITKNKFGGSLTEKQKQWKTWYEKEKL